MYIHDTQQSVIT